jgi:phosphoadenosine phosphosulfate reductase
MASQQRIIDRIDTAAAFTEADAVALNLRFAEASTEEVLRAVLVDKVAGNVTLVSSFGADSAVLLHLASRIDLRCPCCSSKPASISPKRWPIAMTLPSASA